jgi:hypothetical protein
MAYDLIEKVTVATATATVSFATLPTTYKDLKVFISGRSQMPHLCVFVAI